jgi:hypothetical protein
MWEMDKENRMLREHTYVEIKKSDLEITFYVFQNDLDTFPSLSPGNINV